LRKGVESDAALKKPKPATFAFCDINILARILK